VLGIIAICIGMMAAVLLLRSWWPVVAGGALFWLIIVRTSWKARWKSNNPVTLLMYGVHAHLQQMPIYLGQLQYRRDRRSGMAAKLIEYKRS
jgi:hypothetical protein